MVYDGGLSPKAVKKIKKTSCSGSNMRWVTNINQTSQFEDKLSIPTNKNYWREGIHMSEAEEVLKEEQIQEDNKKFSEVNEFNHERNQAAIAQKQMSSQETTGVIDQE
jgi:hypothetical protein